MEDEFPLNMGDFQGQTVNLLEGNVFDKPIETPETSSSVEGAVDPPKSSNSDPPLREKTRQPLWVSG